MKGYKAMTNSNAKKYLKQIKALLPVLSKQEKRFLKDMKNDVDEFSNDNPEVTFEDLTDKFGNPNDVVHNYIESVDLDYMIKCISSRKLIRRTAIIVLVLAFIGFCAFIGSVYMAYLDSQNSVITQEVIVIE